MVVTPLGTQSGALEVEVWADNWLSALRAGRKQQGEDGGVPAGASCAMSATGVVTILDARNRRRFVLSPAGVPLAATPPAAANDVALPSAVSEPEPSGPAPESADAAPAPVPAAAPMPGPATPTPPAALESPAPAPPAQATLRSHAEQPRPSASGSDPQQPRPSAAGSDPQQPRPSAAGSDPQQALAPTESPRLDPRAPNSAARPAAGTTTLRSHAEPPLASNATPAATTLRSHAEQPLASTATPAATTLRSHAEQALASTATPAATTLRSHAEQPPASTPPRVATAPALPPVGLAAMRAAAELVQTQPPEAAPSNVLAVGETTRAEEPSAGAEPTPAPARAARIANTQATAAIPASGHEAGSASVQNGEHADDEEDDALAWESARASVLGWRAEEPGAELTGSRAGAAGASTSESVGPVAVADAEATSGQAAPSDEQARDAGPLPEEHSSPRAKQTRAYSPQRAEALRREFETSRALAGATTSASSTPSSADGEKVSPRPALRAVPPAPPPAAFASSPPAGGAAPSEASSTVRSRAEEAHGPALPAGKSGSPGAHEVPAPRVSVPRVSHPQGLVLLVSRDAEPTPEAPLTYRERSYWVARSSDHARLEALLQAEYIALRRELLTHPRGQLIHLAAFDHVFDEQPSRPPLATLEWKDWRGTAVFRVTMEPEEGEERSAVLERPPAQRAPESEWPLPAGSRVRDQVSAKPSPVSTWPLPPTQRSAQPRRAGPPAQPPAVPASGSSSRPAPPAARGPHARTPPPAPAAASTTQRGSSWPPVASADSVSSWPAMSTIHDPFHTAASTREPTGEVDHRLASAFEAMPELYFLSTPVSGLEFTIEVLTTLVPCEAVSACLYDINTDEFRFVALSGPGAATRRASAIPSQAGLFGAAKRAPGEALAVANAAGDSRFVAQVDGREGLEVRSLVYLPVRFGGQLLGIVQLINRSKEASFTAADVAVLTYVCAQLAEFLLSRRTL